MEETDKELLEKAAKASGEEMEWDGNGRYLLRPVPWRNFVNYEPWNPLTDDGDALRLAVKLGIMVAPPAFNGGFEATASAKAEGFPWIDDSYSGDHDALTRRAITRAAAAMVD